MIEKNKCLVCGFEGKSIKSINIHISQKANGGCKAHKNYIKEFHKVLDLYIPKDLYFPEIEMIVKNKHKKFKNFVNLSKIRDRQRQIWPDRGWSVVSRRRTGDGNPTKDMKVRDKIRQTVKGQWEAGSYKNKIDGMLEKYEEKNSVFELEKNEATYLAERKYVDFLSNFQDVDICVRCGKNRSEIKINIHHIDENHENFLISNLEPLCVPCHVSYHFKGRKKEYITVVKSFSFSAAHWLPNYDGSCKFTHGHDWLVEVGVRKRIDPDTGMVMDFRDLKLVMKEYIIDLLDHDIVNYYLDNPTAENLCIWIWERLMFEALLKGIEFITVWESKSSYSKIEVSGMLSVFKTKIEKYLKEKKKGKDD